VDNHLPAGRPRRPLRQQGLRLDVGTLWTMGRDGYTAHCALIWLPHTWELRVLIDDDVLLSEQCATQARVLAVADAWRGRLAECGWAPPAATGSAANPAGEDGPDRVAGGLLDGASPSRARGRPRRQRGAKSQQ
jgi:hypothetical protein